jgi:hypothetical protein
VADAEQAAELLGEADGEALVELSEEEAEADGDEPEPAPEEPEPALNSAPPATGELTETSLSAWAPRFTMTIRSVRLEPLA